MTDIQNIPLKTINGGEDKLANHKGKVLLVVNVASKCGLTPQYDGLEKLYQAKKDEGFEVLGFPANNFKGQEPGSDDEIQKFCTLTYDVHFPMFSKISVVGDDQHPLYAALVKAQPKAQADGPFRERLKGYGITAADERDVLWNFEKFVINRKGKVVARFAPDVAADDPELVKVIDQELARA